MASIAGGCEPGRKHGFATFERHERGDPNGAALLHHFERLVVKERAVFDGVDAGADGALGAGGAMGMGGGFLAQGVGFVDERVQFFLRQLRGVDFVG